MTNKSQQLSSKERTLFQGVVKFYENKQYKKGLRSAEQILKKVPNHGDTKAMKALILNTQGQSEEAFALGKEALKDDMKSHVCWHVYGLLYRSKKDFEESIKAYKFALRLDPENKQIQRDLALLQIQIRDYEGFKQSRRAMLSAQPALRSNWTALAIAQHLAGDLADAERTLTTYEETLKTPPPKTDDEHVQAILYKNSIIAEMGEYQRALEHLDAVSRHYVDKTTVLELRADYQMKLNQHDAAQRTFKALLDRNADYSRYYEGLQAAMELDVKDPRAVKELYDEWAEKNPRGDAARRIPLDLLEGEEFREAADRYLQRMLHKAIPSTFANVKKLYTDTEKLKTVQDLVESYASGTHTPQANGSTDKTSDGPPTFEIYTNYFLAQHYNYHLSRDLPKAMTFIEKAIAASPKEVDFVMTKARIQKHQGDFVSASKTMAEARWLDDRDRYSNTRSAKYQLRNDENEAAIETMSKWTRNEAVGGALGDLHDMQCVWYLTEDGESYSRQDKLGLALKRFHAVNTVFETWEEDQFDFHMFSLRKGQIRTYVQLLRWEDRLRDHPFYARAALAAIKTYLLLHDQPERAHGPTMTNGVNGNGTADGAAKKKKAAKKARKQKEEEQRKEAEKADAKKTAGKVDALGEVKKEDPDPMGEALVATKEPLMDAMKFVTPLLESCPRDVRAQEAAFEVFIRRKKYLLALKALLAAHALAPTHPPTHHQAIRLALAISTTTPSPPLPPASLEVLTAELLTLLPDGLAPADLQKRNGTYQSENEIGAARARAGWRAAWELDRASKAEGEKTLRGLLKEGISLEDVVGGLELVQFWGGDVAAYKEAARKVWPRAKVLGA